MKICVAQTKPFKGNVIKNMDQHLHLIQLAVSKGADTIIFPELSLTGYEPTLAESLATDPEDKRFSVLQEISDSKNIIIGVGVPTKNYRGTCISMIIIQPFRPRHCYHKHYLHADEEPYFVSGENPKGSKLGETGISLAICYEISVPEHAKNAHQEGIEIYLASVAKTGKGVEKAWKTLAEISRNYAMTVMMSNCVGFCDGEQCGGKSAVWNKDGQLLGQLDGRSEGLLIFDTSTHKIIR